MKLSVMTTTMLALLLIGSAATRDGHAATESMPFGVSHDNWIALGEDVGFLIVQESEADGVPSLRGYFLARRDGSWMRLDSEGGFRTIPIR
jgi:hypothetical protein